MIKINKIILYVLLATFIQSCSNLSDAGKTLRNEKIKSTDEFLVKKRDALSLPPDFDTLPKPGSIIKKKKEDSIETILNVSKDQKITNQKSSSVEDSIINKIGK